MKPKPISELGKALRERLSNQPTPKIGRPRKESVQPGDGKQQEARPYCKCGHTKEQHDNCEVGEYCTADGCRCVDGEQLPHRQTSHASGEPGPALQLYLETRPEHSNEEDAFHAGWNAAKAAVESPQDNLAALVAKWRKIAAECPSKYRNKWRDVFEAVETCADELEHSLAGAEPQPTQQAHQLALDTIDRLQDERDDLKAKLAAGGFPLAALEMATRTLFAVRLDEAKQWAAHRPGDGFYQTRVSELEASLARAGAVEPPQDKLREAVSELHGRARKEAQRFIRSKTLYPEYHAAEVAYETVLRLIDAESNRLATCEPGASERT